MMIFSKYVDSKWKNPLTGGAGGLGENEAGNVGGEKSPWAEGKNDSLGGSSFGAEIHEFHEFEKFGSRRLGAFLGDKLLDWDFCL